MKPEQGDFIYVRMEFRHIFDTGKFICWLRDPGTHGFSQIAVPASQIVCLEPKAMEADHGIVRGI